jgi:ribosomal protein L11 methylase PrmA
MTQLTSSFRDPNGFLFERDGALYRQVNLSYQADYDLLMGSGLYAKLVELGRLVPHSEVDIAPADPALAYRVIEPVRVPFISYPYEWSFSMLKDAALVTLSIHKRALKAGLSLKDASAYNIQFFNGKAALIDTLSFEMYREGEPWVAYKQFCQHFLTPLALMAKVDVRLGQLSRVYIDGVPLDLAARLLPFGTRFDFGLLTHVHAHARAQAQYANKQAQKPGAAAGMSLQAMQGLIENLENTIRKLEWTPRGTEWGDYYENTNYSDTAFEAKKALVREWSARVGALTVWDLGANTGVFSREAGAGGARVVAWDIDPTAVEVNYRQTKKAKEQNILPLLLDLTNPSPALGWNHAERDSFGGRSNADLVLALAVIHHLAISNNVPLAQLAAFFAGLSCWLVIEFVPKSDSQVVRLLASREDIFAEYTKDDFERVFSTRFKIHEARSVADSERTLYLMERLPV